jgi:glycosyltransferase involved in cell wall biosynthesis
MNVLFVTSWFPSKLQPTNGNFIERHLNAVQASGHRVIVVHIEYSNRILFPQMVQRQVNGSEVFHIFIPRLFKPLKPLKRMFGELLLGKFKRLGFEPHIIHGHVYYPMGEWAIFFKSKFQIPFVCTEHWSGYREVNKDRYTDNVKRMVEASVAATEIILPVSKDLQSIMEEKGLFGKYKVVNNAVDTSVFRPMPRTHEKFRFLHISNFDPRAKNTEGIIRVFSKLNRPDCELVIAGDGDLNRLKTFIESENIDDAKILFKGMLTYSEVADEMHQSDCHILFSNFENLPCVIAESHCCGIPVIATSVGGIPEMVDRENGILVNPEDEVELLRAMKQMIDDSKRFVSSDISTRAASRYGYQAIGSEFSQVYYSLIQI